MGREILLYPHPVLRETCIPFDFANPEHIALAKEMRTMVGPEHGRGLAAPQLDLPINLFATCFHPEPPTLYINPKITHFSDETITLSEGCRSLPWFTVDVERPVAITIEATDLNGNPFTHSLDGWESRVVQHEQDHLSGILNIDRILEIERQKLDIPIQ